MKRVGFISFTPKVKGSPCPFGSAVLHNRLDEWRVLWDLMGSQPEMVRTGLIRPIRVACAAFSMSADSWTARGFIKRMVLPPYIYAGFSQRLENLEDKDGHEKSLNIKKRIKELKNKLSEILDIDEVC